MRFIELTDNLGVKFLLNPSKIETIFDTGETVSIALSPESGIITTKESYSEVKSLIRHAEQK